VEPGTERISAELTRNFKLCGALPVLSAWVIAVACAVVRDVSTA
jgi:hypothetical protein